MTLVPHPSGLHGGVGGEHGQVGQGHSFGAGHELAAGRPTVHPAKNLQNNKEKG